jgi:hypothetical protein
LIEALELGNEPNLYGTLTWYVKPYGVHVFGRPPTTTSSRSSTVAELTPGHGRYEFTLPAESAALVTLT